MKIDAKTIGSLLLGAAFAAIGLFASSLTRNQIIAFIAGMAICFTLTLIDKMLFFMPDGALSVIQYMGADYHFKSIARGIIDSRDIVYFISVIFVMLFATGIAVKERS